MSKPWLPRSSKMGGYARIALSGKRGRGLFALVSPEDAERVRRHSWSIGTHGYPEARFADRSLVRLHRFILGLAAGDRRQGDHVRGNKLDCRRDKLRICTNAQNVQNRQRRPSHARDQHLPPGIRWEPQRAKYGARVMANGKYVLLKRFEKLDDAIAARRKALAAHRKEFASAL